MAASTASALQILQVSSARQGRDLEFSAASRGPDRFCSCRRCSHRSRHSPTKARSQSGSLPWPTRQLSRLSEPLLPPSHLSAQRPTRAQGSAEPERRAGACVREGSVREVSLRAPISQLTNVTLLRPRSSGWTRAVRRSRIRHCLSACDGPNTDTGSFG